MRNFFVLRGRHFFIYDVMVTAVAIVLAFLLRFDRASFVVVDLKLRRQPDVARQRQPESSRRAVVN